MGKEMLLWLSWIIWKRKCIWIFCIRSAVNTSVRQLKNRNDCIAVPTSPLLIQSGYLTALYLFVSATASFRTVLFSLFSELPEFTQDVGARTGNGALFSWVARWHSDNWTQLPSLWAWTGHRNVFFWQRRRGTSASLPYFVLVWSGRLQFSCRARLFKLDDQQPHVFQYFLECIRDEFQTAHKTYVTAQKTVPVAFTNL